MRISQCSWGTYEMTPRPHRTTNFVSYIEPHFPLPHRCFRTGARRSPRASSTHTDTPPSPTCTCASLSALGVPTTWPPDHIGPPLLPNTLNPIFRSRTGSFVLGHATAAHRHPQGVDDQPTGARTQHTYTHALLRISHCARPHTDQTSLSRSR